MKKLKRLLNFKNRLAGIRSVLSHDRNAAAITDVMTVKTGPRGVNHPITESISNTITGITALGISCFIKYVSCFNYISFIYVVIIHFHNSFFNI